VNDVTGPLVVRHDVVQDLAHLLEIHDGGREEALSRLRVAEDRRQRLVQLMGQRRGELPEGGHPADVGQLLSEPLRLELPLLARQRIGASPRRRSCCISSSDFARSAATVLNTSPPTTVPPTSRGIATWGLTRW
jgi:hypothetical protein